MRSFGEWEVGKTFTSLGNKPRGHEKPWNARFLQIWQWLLLSTPVRILGTYFRKREVSKTHLDQYFQPTPLCTTPQPHWFDGRMLKFLPLKKKKTKASLAQDSFQNRLEFCCYLRRQKKPFPTQNSSQMRYLFAKQREWQEFRECLKHKVWGTTRNMKSSPNSIKIDQVPSKRLHSGRGKSMEKPIGE